MRSLTPRQKLFSARAAIREKLPYFTALVNGLNYHWVTPGSLNTMGVTDTGVVLLDEVDIGRMTVEQTAVSLLHEAAGHWLREHRKRKPQGCDHGLWNLAGDCEINDDLREMTRRIPGWEVPEGMVYPDTYQLPDNMTAEWYYAEIRKQAPNKAMQPKCGQGWCGSGAGHPMPNEPKPPTKPQDKGEPTKGGQDGKALQDGAGSSEGGENECPTGRTEADRGRIAQQVAGAIQKHQRQHGQGSVPAGWSVWADDMLKPPVVNWQQELDQVVRHAITYRPGAVVTTWRKFGRKQAALGYGVGRPLTPAWRNPVPRIAVCVDTSGSMGREELSIAVSETDAVLKAVHGDVEFVALDAKVHEAKKVTSIAEVAELLKGGGGTDFRPAFEYFDKKRDRPDVLIFITDGMGPGPNVPPSGMAVVWLIVGSSGCRPSCDHGAVEWGKFLFLQEVNGEIVRTPDREAA